MTVNKQFSVLILCMTTFFCGAMENREVVNKKIGVVSCKNKRDYQEDRFYHGVVDGGEWYAVYDGHGIREYGDKVSHFLKETLHDYFCQTSGSMRERMIQAFKNADDNQYVKLYTKIGSTASVVYIKDNIAHFAHVGDSRALLECGGMIAFATEDHKPLRCDEKERIEKAEGVISFCRVDGTLAVSRAIGDHHYDKKIVIPEPEYTQKTLTKQHKFLILASDGLWDVVDNEDVVKVLELKQMEIDDMNVFAKMLVDLAIEKHSTDNITVMVVDLL
jgi:serine/threonine protein phosphatase PrpC